MSPPDGPLLPIIDAINRPFFEGARIGELRVQRCRDTGRLIFPPRERSPWAPVVGRSPDWTTVSGRGAIWSFAIPHPPLLPWYSERAPYNVIVVALEEDPTLRMVGNLIPAAGGSIGDFGASSIEIGAAVKVVFQVVGGELELPSWVLV
jgi:uncharacterized OB-fold protein